VPPGARVRVEPDSEGGVELERAEEQGATAEPHADPDDQVPKLMNGGDRETDQEGEKANEHAFGESPRVRKQLLELSQHPLMKGFDEGWTPDDQEGQDRKAKDDSEKDGGG
jgi:hypothetical protein